MTDEKKLKLPSPALCKTVWREEGHPSFRSLASILTGRGYEVSNQTINNYFAKDPEWMIEKDLVGQQPAPAADTVNKLCMLLDAADKDSIALKPAHFDGIKATLVGRLYQTARTLPLGTAADWIAAVDALNLLDAQAHKLKGAQIKSIQPGGGILDKLAPSAPSIAVSEFKKPAVKGSH